MLSSAWHFIYSSILFVDSLGYWYYDNDYIYTNKSVPMFIELMKISALYRFSNFIYMMASCLACSHRLLILCIVHLTVICCIIDAQVQ